ncbi:protein nanos [Lucilia sericata]|uniref:protein nanos n=1 Tax=Lucilia sericata TaxID=13632 RepID=UPI0018A82A12|nr:protein nanos [Lucilia sericata]
MQSADVMYRSSPESNMQNAETFTNLLGLNMKCFQEMYLDTCASLAAAGSTTSSPSISPTSSNGTSATGSLLLSPVSMSPPNSSACHSSNTSSSSPTGSGGLGSIGFENMTAIQQQQLLAAHQQHLAAAAVAQHQLAMAAAAAAGNQQSSTALANGSNIGGSSTTSQQQQDEISKSLKMFAMLTAYSNETPTITPQQQQQLSTHSPVDAVMQDFACNGYICDELNRYQLGMNLTNNTSTATAANLHNSTSNGQHQPNSGIASSNAAAAAAVAAAATLNQQQLQQQLQQHNLNINFNNNFWKMLPSHMQQHSNAVSAAAAAAAAATAAAAVNIDYNCNQKKLPKRYGNKNEKYSSAKHCVFCENNNEPEAVVKSHAVRDSLGRVLCPKLRTYICPICKASGDMAHTVKYCPQKPIITMEDAIKAESFRLAKDTYYKQQMKV